MCLPSLSIGYLNLQYLTVSLILVCDCIELNTSIALIITHIKLALLKLGLLKLGLLKLALLKLGLLKLGLLKLALLKLALLKLALLKLALLKLALLLYVYLYSTMSCMSTFVNSSQNCLLFVCLLFVCLLLFPDILVHLSICDVLCCFCIAPVSSCW